MKFSMYLNNFLEIANVISKSIGKDGNASFESVDGKRVSEHTIFKIHDNKLIIQHRTSQSFFKGSVDFKDIEMSKELEKAKELQPKIDFYQGKIDIIEKQEKIKTTQNKINLLQSISDKEDTEENKEEKIKKLQSQIIQEEKEIQEIQNKINLLQENINFDTEENKEDINDNEKLDKLKLNMLKLFNFEVDSFQLRTILSVIPKDESVITFELSDDCRQFEIHTLHCDLKLPIYDRFQDTTKEEEITILGTVSANDFLSTINDLNKIVPSENILQNTPASCLHIFGKQDKLVFMATNSVVLVEKTINLEDSENDFTILLKPHLANLLLSSKFEADDIVSIYATKTQFGIIDKYNTLCLVAKAASNFIPLQYEKFKAITSTEQIINVQSGQFKNAVDNVAKLCTISNEEIFNVFSNKIVVENKNKDKIEIPMTGDIDDIQFKILKPSLSLLFHLFSEKFNITWKKENKDNILMFQNLDSDNNVEEDIFMIITTNK